jgi:hypothetical protein
MRAAGTLLRARNMSAASSWARLGIADRISCSSASVIREASCEGEGTRARSATSSSGGTSVILEGVGESRWEGVGAHPMMTEGDGGGGVEVSDSDGKAELVRMAFGWAGARPPCSCSSRKADMNGWELSGSSGPRGP